MPIAKVGIWRPNQSPETPTTQFTAFEELEKLRQSLLARCTPVAVLTAGEIASELFALEPEFENVELNLADQSVGVQTDAIELEGICLGPFRIVLAWNRIGHSSHPYNVYAIEPYHPQDRAVAAATGETAEAIAHQGFGFV